MKIIVVKAFLLAGCLLCASGHTLAEQRVLLSFDHAGHELRKLVQTDNATYKRFKSTITSQVADIESMYQDLTPGVVTLVWTDADGYLERKTTAPDPRISRAPAHIDGLDKSLQTVTQGAWLVTGPQSASRLIILMAAHESLNLPFERWEVELIQ